MTAPAPADDPYEKANSQVRDAAKWLIGSSAAVGAALIAGSQLSSIGKLSIGWSVPEAARLWIAVVGAVLGLVAIVYILWTAVKLLPEVQVTLQDLEDEWDTSTPRLLPAITHLKDNPRLMQGFDSPIELAEHRTAAVENLDVLTDEAKIEERKKYIADLDARIDKIEKRASSRVLFGQFESALRKLLAATVLAAVGIIGFAWAANPPDTPPVADMTNARLAGTNLRDADLANAVLDNADLSQADLTGADLTDASIVDVVWSDTTCPDGKNSDSVGGTCAGHLDG